jgi:flagella basal body P-ring formation protein FlgA
VVDRGTILSRLASEGIKASEVTISGAERVNIRRDEEAIGGERFVEVAKEFLKAQSQYSEASKIEPVLMPKGWVLNDCEGQIRLVPRRVDTRFASKPKVWVSILVDGVEKGVREVIFKLRYNRPEAVATVDIPVGTVIGPEHIEIKSVVSNIPKSSKWAPPYGLVAKRTIREGSVVTDKMAGPPEAPVLITRKQQVYLKIETGGLFVSALGEALEDGKVGDYIRVRRGMSNDSRVVVGCVRPDGTVEPVY